MLGEIFAFVCANWVEWLFATALTLLSLVYRHMLTLLKAERARNDAITAGMQCLLRDCIVSKYSQYRTAEHCPVYEKENMRRMYAAYHALGGNDVATALYNKILSMPESKEEEDHAEVKEQKLF
jgi:hypothetical protein